MTILYDKLLVVYDEYCMTTAFEAAKTWRKLLLRYDPAARSEA